MTYIPPIALQLKTFSSVEERNKVSGTDKNLSKKNRL
jgi:hypothetical protein